MSEAHFDLIEKLAEFSNDPHGYVLYAYPWGEEGELKNFAGPEGWQLDLLAKIERGVVSIEEAIATAQSREEGASVETSAMLFGTTSGHGIGKSAFVCWLIDWAQSTMADTKGVVTANTENQLKTKTWAEMAKWHRLSISKDLFKMTATARFSIDPDHEKTWRIDMVPWSEKNMEAFAGLHNAGKRILIVFDEASAIPNAIWETTEGALTDKNTQIIWAVFGNPTKNTGRFRECFEGGKFAHRWDTIAVDSREVSLTDKTQIKNWIEDYGEDHDFVRVRVRGMFPRTDATSFIPLEMCLEATRRLLPEQNEMSVVLGVDVARFGPDNSVIYARRGLDARSIPPQLFNGLTTVQLASRVFDAYMNLQAVAIFVDGGAMGPGVIDQLNLMGAPVYEVNFGGKSDMPNADDSFMKFLNKRAEIWGAVRTFLKRGCIPADIRGLQHTFVDELTGPTYTYARESILQLESKRDMRRRGVASPDVADALALTFAYSGYDSVPMAVSGSQRYEDSPNSNEGNSYA
jgi:hypothetical protein